MARFMPFARSFRAQLTALYLAFFSLLFILFSIFLYGELSRSLTARTRTKTLRSVRCR